MSKLKFSLEQQSFIKENYGKIPTHQIADKYGATVRQVAITARKLGANSSINCRKLKYGYDEQFFDISDSLLNCYWAGFIAADGCISDRKLLDINQAPVDRCQIENFVRDIEYKGNIHEYKQNGYKEGKYISLKMTLSQYTVDKLRENFGIVPRKTFILKAPPANLTFEQKISFMIGYIDGDGCIDRDYCTNNREYDRIRILGTYELLSWFKELLIQIDSGFEKVNVGKDTGKNIHRLSIKGLKATKFLEYCRKFELPMLQRKWNRYK